MQSEGLWYGHDSSQTFWSYFRGVRTTAAPLCMRLARSGCCDPEGWRRLSEARIHASSVGTKECPHVGGGGSRTNARRCPVSLGRVPRRKHVWFSIKCSWWNRQLTKEINMERDGERYRVNLRRWPENEVIKSAQAAIDRVTVTPKLVQTVQQHASNEFLWIRGTCDYISLNAYYCMLFSRVMVMIRIWFIVWLISG